MQSKVSISQSSLGGSRLSSCMFLFPFVKVSISQSSLGRFTRSLNARRMILNWRFQSRNRVWAGSRPGPAMRGWRSSVSISQSSLGGSRPSGAIALCARRLRSFNLAIEFGRFTPEESTQSRCAASRFQSRNRVWAVHASFSLTGQSTCFARFQSRNRVWAVHARAVAWHINADHEFQSRNRVWAVHACIKSDCTHVILGFNLAIEFGPVHAPVHQAGRPQGQDVSISQSSLGGSRDEHGSWEFGCEFVSISQSSLGGSRMPIYYSQLPTALFQSRNRVWAVHALADYRPVSLEFHGFNLAIEFGRFTRAFCQPCGWP